MNFVLFFEIFTLLTSATAADFEDLLNFWEGVGVDDPNYLPDPGFVNFTHYLVKERTGEPIYKNCKTCLLKFIIHAKTVFIVHGYLASGKGPFPDSLRHALSSTYEQLNIVVVDWGELAGGIKYWRAAQNIRIVGKVIAELIDFLIKARVTSIDKIIYIGHSLGAQTANFVAEHLRNQGRQLHRIFALDPALPYFGYKRNVNETDRIDKSDAKLVIGVHTDAGGLGFKDPIGDVDFYANKDGYEQPGCTLTYGKRDVCRHSRSYYYLAEAIRNPFAFPALQCNSWIEYENSGCNDNHLVYFNLDINHRAEGVYYFRTNPFSPFGEINNY